MMKFRKLTLLAIITFVSTFLTGQFAVAESSNPERDVYFGDTHAHSELSGDAYGFGNRLPPERTRLAKEETFAAVVRTALSVIGFGIAVID